MIGGTAAGARNVISGNKYSGIYLYTSGGGSILQGNYIGTDVTGTKALGNLNNGINILNGNNTIGGAQTGARNIISGNLKNGVYISSSYWAGNILQGNYIGTNMNGTASLGNGEHGVFILQVPDNIIGGTTPQERNIISGNGADGVHLTNNTTGNIVQGNFIGTDANGVANLGNGGSGVVNYGFGNTIGGMTAGAGNIISGNKKIGVLMAYDFRQSGAGNRVHGNAIFNNTALGIDLKGDGVTLNDLGDSDGVLEVNHLQNFPLLTFASNSALNGTLNSTASTTFRVEFFASAACDPSGYGEGEQFLGALDNVITDGSGNAAFTYPFTPASSKLYLTTTATNITTGDTSEFSPCFPVDARSFLFLPLIVR